MFFFIGYELIPQATEHLMKSMKSLTRMNRPIIQIFTLNNEKEHPPPVENSIIHVQFNSKYHYENINIK